MFGYAKIEKQRDYELDWLRVLKIPTLRVSPLDIVRARQPGNAMRVIQRLSLHIAALFMMIAASSCIANPTPHPGSNDNNGLNSLGTGGAMESAASADEEGANNALDESFEDMASESEPSAGSGPNATEDASSSDEDAESAEDACFDRLETALSSGVQMYKDDFVFPIEGMTYWLDFPDGQPARCNAVTAPPECTAEALESL